MSHEELRRALDAVHRELGQTKHLDPDEVSRLRETMHEIQTALGRDEENAPPLSHRVNESARHFEETHPRLTETLGRIADMLQQMGI